MLVPHSFVALLFFMMVGHALADYPLQGDFLSIAKNPRHATGAALWRWTLPMHGLIHGGFVALITGSITLGMIEVILHCITDYAKCMNRITFGQDQMIHWGCKVVYAAIVAVSFT